jgi:hypothetical protein
VKLAPSCPYNVILTATKQPSVPSECYHQTSFLVYPYDAFPRCLQLTPFFSYYLCVVLFVFIVFCHHLLIQIQPLQAALWLRSQKFFSHGANAKNSCNTCPVCHGRGQEYYSNDSLKFQTIQISFHIPSVTECTCFIEHPMFLVVLLSASFRKGSTFFSLNNFLSYAEVNTNTPYEFFSSL